MSILAVVLIICSAVMHASWNFLAKKGHMNLPFYAVLCTGAPLLLGHILFWTPVALSRLPGMFWFWLACTIVSDITYCCGLAMTYRFFDMSSAYPVMRSLPILMTVLVTWLFGIGKTLSGPALAGMAVVFVGCMMMPLMRFRDFSLRIYMKKSLFFVLLASCGITGYTLGDCEAQRCIRSVGSEAGTVMTSLTYYALRNLLLALTLWIGIVLIPKFRGEARTMFGSGEWRTPAKACVFSMSTYILVLTAMNFVDNPSYVQVLRQIGLPVGMGFGVIFLKEKCTFPKIVGCALILLGLILTML